MRNASGLQYMTSKAKTTKTDKQNYIKQKYFCTTKKTINKREATIQKEGKYLQTIHLSKG